jgi:phosphate transport system protein
LVRTPLEKGMDKIEREILEIAEIAKKAVLLSVESLKERNIEKAKEVADLEEKSDILNLDIDNDCLKLLALQQPVAKDLRFVHTMLKISDNFERIADLALKIAEITPKYEKKPLLKPLIDIPRMAETISQMIDTDITAIKTKVPPDTDKLISEDDFLDDLYSQIYNELLSFMLRDPRNIDDATDLIFVARYLERIGDIAAKTGARIYYMITGERVWVK